MHCLLLQESHQTVAEAGREQVGEEIEVPEHTLGQDDACSNEDAGLFKLNEHKQVSSLVFSLFQQVMDDSVVGLHGSQ